MSILVSIVRRFESRFSPGSFLFPNLEIFGTKKERLQLTEQRARRRASKRLTGQAEGLEPKTGVSPSTLFFSKKRVNGVLGSPFCGFRDDFATSLF